MKSHMRLRAFALTQTIGRHLALLAATVALLLFTPGLAGMARADNSSLVIVTFNNGDRLTGQMVSVTAAQLELETSYAGRVRLRIAEIKSWQTVDNKLRQHLSAFLPLKDKALFVEASKARTQPPPPSVMKAMPWQRTLNFAYTLARGNVNLSDLTAAFSLTRQYGPRRFAFSSFGRYGVRNGAEVADLLTGTLRYERTLMRLPVFTETAFEIDRIKRLNHRLSENLGVTYHVLKGEGPTLSFDFGTGFTQEVYRTGLRRNRASSLLRLNAAQKLMGKTQLTQQVTLFSDLFDPTAYRMQTNVSLTTPLNKHLSLQLMGLNRFDHRPPPFVKKNDFSLLTGISFNF